MFFVNFIMINLCIFKLFNFHKIDYLLPTKYIIIII